MYYVDASNRAPAGGLSWATAYTDLQQALKHATAGSEVWVAKGTYYTRDGVGKTPNPQASFVVPSGVRVVGGFSGMEDSAAMADPATNRTILSGDQSQDDGGAVPHFSDNSIHVVTLPLCSPGTVVDGFTIEGGYAFGTNNELETRGGGIMISGGAPEVRRCRITANAALVGGGGIDINNKSEAVLTHCVVSGNSSVVGAGVLVGKASVTIRHCDFGPNAIGGAIGIRKNSFLSLTDSVLHDGGGETGAGTVFFYPEGDNVGEIRRCRFLGNSTGASGAAIGAQGDAGLSTPSLTPLVIEDCEFLGNRAFLHGGAIYATKRDLEVRRSTFCLNSASQGAGAVYCGFTSTARIEGCIFWANASGAPAPEQVHLELPAVPEFVLNTCDIQGLTADLAAHGEDNIDADPAFVNLLGADGVAGTPDDNAAVQSWSPCIDAGIDGLVLGQDVRGAPRLIDGDLDGEMHVDIGANEFSNVALGTSTTQASTIIDITSAVPMLGQLIVGRCDIGPIVPPYGACLIATQGAYCRIVVGMLPAQLSVPADLLPAATIGNALSVQALGLSAVPGMGNFSSVVSLE